eukprot:SAG11_NODE_22083_length_412_cov_1.638978_1_plen_51_part_01
MPKTLSAAAADLALSGTAICAIPTHYTACIYRERAREGIYFGERTDAIPTP